MLARQPLEERGLVDWTGGGGGGGILYYPSSPSRAGEGVGWWRGWSRVFFFVIIPTSFVLDLLSEFPEQTVMDGVADGSLGLDQQMLSDSALFIFSLAKESILFYIFCCRQMLFSCWCSAVVIVIFYLIVIAKPACPSPCYMDSHGCSEEIWGQLVALSAVSERWTAQGIRCYGWGTHTDSKLSAGFGFTARILIYFGLTLFVKSCEYSSINARS